eukprot:gene10657-biopygen8526
MQLHHTKCSQLIKNVVSPSLKHELQKDVEGKGFAVLIDESTDVAAKKNLCICIRYFSEQEMQVATAFVGMIEVVEVTGENLFQAVKTGLQTVGLDLHNCFGFASDGASTMVGEWNSVWSRIRESSPNCIRMKCICHSLALCVQHAFEKMPSNLGFLLKEIPKWFSKSILRREAFHQLIDVMNPNNEHAEFERVNASFQATNADPEDMVKQLFLLHSTLRYRIYGSGDEVLPNSRVDFGVKFVMESQKYIHHHGNSAEAKLKVEEVYNRCQSFLVEALTQVENRLPGNETIFKGLSYLSPATVLSQVDRVPFCSLPMLHVMVDISSVEEEYRRILHVDWAGESVLNGFVPRDSAEFWCGILKYTSSTGEQPFKRLALYALTALAIPVSNAICERVFSHVTNVKTKLRSRMRLDMLDAVIRIQVNFKFGQKCCRDLRVSPEMIELFNSANMYNQGESSADADEANLNAYL